MPNVHSLSLDSVEAGAPEQEIEITQVMLAAGAQVICECFDEFSSFGEHVADRVFRAMYAHLEK
jgi:hypothetical protein